MALSHIVAASDNDVIGVKNDLPWYIPDDLEFFKMKTLHNYIIMGRKTFESIGRVLPHRTSIVISRTLKEVPKGVILARSLEEAIGQYNTRATRSQEAFVIGGGEIYRQSMDLIDCIYMTRVHVTLKGDTYYPRMPKNRFELGSAHYSSESIPHTFYKYIRK